ncbi:transmembrane protein [Perilla frutescens var. hirtella]|uniref:Transmembrane protein n=1 Tax=Perilla frutescens var. hirtella TaxID=608512 RepID=A0AAD4PAA8_PERFH|nr:transmembrane protein [Perilla frutescens var. hirtella]
MEMNWVQRKIYLYNVTFGLYMLDWWERFLFNTLMVVLMWFVCYNGFRFASDVSNRLLHSPYEVHSFLQKNVQEVSWCCASRLF